ncbi:MAG: glycosyltransferase [Snodgrassella sp.]|uniref:glycosyltransferase family 2 protein n=1 Tax=Snodgrassella sp. TaxID=2815304 RepID=UPI002584AE18|nr:glycosyltransferase family 2 protein [Snodgrassella sp.]MCO6521494.1 glycosyltransferase [Snodgrassella sp.]MCO6527161.1 glycosyltransferase [Snodgrassella sp.]
MNIAILIPCYNEAITIEKVINDFRQAIPNSTIYVYDNNSIDNTSVIATNAGAIVKKENIQGKGAVVRKMFVDIDADYYIMVDGDDTYDAEIAPQMLNLAIQNDYDLVNAIRKETEDNAYRSGHRLGNKVITGAVRLLFGNRIQDMLSGYKIFSKRFVKSFPAMEKGFAIETEIAIHALQLNSAIGHINTSYRGRPEGSTSKLNTYKDGLRILILIIKLCKHERPLLLFGSISLMLILVSLILFIPILVNYYNTGLVPRFPTLITAVGTGIVSIICFFSGLILNTISKGIKELKYLCYLNVK